MQPMRRSLGGEQRPPRWDYVSSFPAPRMGLRRPAAAWLALPSLRLELAEKLQLREQDCLLEIRCGWQALGCREHW